ncbi:MAG: hypothetical protein FWD61_04040 [Phycisphaerales bacterium]|nr:hypothetical protein [Phycisphaerales bacterium]
MHAALVALGFLAQLPAKALPADEPGIKPEPSSVLTLLLGVFFCVFVLFITFKASRRNQVNE